MNRSWIVIAKIEDLTDIAPLKRLWYAESNSPNNKIRLSGNPEVLDATKILLNALPPTYDKEAAKELMLRAVEEIFE